jgi:anti-sigma-K factor RskA
MNEIHALSGAYAVDALDDGERAEFERHLAVCADCRAEVASFHETTALLAETEAETPPASLRAGVLSGIGQVRPLPPQATVPTVATGATGATVVRRRRAPQLLAAAAAVVLLAVGAVLWHPWQTTHREDLAAQVLGAPDAVKIIEKVPGGHGELTLVRSASLNRAVLIGHDVPPAPSGKTYQMWLQQPGQSMVSAGLMPRADEATLLAGDAATASAAAVSVEPAGGSEHPTTDPVAVFPLRADGTGSDGA